MKNNQYVHNVELKYVRKNFDTHTRTTTYSVLETIFNFAFKQFRMTFKKQKKSTS